VLSVVIEPPINIHLTYTEELAELVEALDATRALSHHEVMRDLVTRLVAAPGRPVWLPNKPDREASFSVYKAGHPATELDQPFLLVFRTRHVVTIVNASSDVTMSSAGYTGFSSI